MAFRQQHRPQSSRQISYHEPPAEIGTASSPQQKRALEESEEWVLFSPGAPSTTARTHTTSTERTPRTAGLSRLSDFGSLDTVARSQEDDDVTEEGEELDSLDDGLHAFHEPSEYAGPSSKLQQSGDTVLPTHDGLGTFQPDADVAEHMWQFERQTPRRRHARRRSSVQRRLNALEETEELTREQDRRQRIEQWRLEQSKALLEEIERETRRRRRMSVASATRSQTDNVQRATKSTTSHVAKSVSDGQSEASDESTENISFWQRLTRRVIRDLMGIDEDTLSVIFGESLPDEIAAAPAEAAPETRPSIDSALRAMDAEGVRDEGWQHRLLERVARELGILVHQLSEHPGAFSAYLAIQDIPEYAGLPARRPSTTVAADSLPSNVTASVSAPMATSANFAPTFPGQPSNVYSEASLWGIEEEPESVDPLDSFRGPRPAPTPVNHAEEIAREQEYWERELDVKMVFNFLLKRFSSRRSSISSQPRRGSSAPTVGEEAEDPQASARRAAIIRHNHPLVNRARESVPTGSGSKKREGATYKTYYHQPPSLRNQVLKSSSSVTSQSTKKSKRSGGSGRNYWDLGGSVGSGSVI
ncbi:hypothetical protein P171DRAFT_318917, partial [Karstenula rhodostoma CBS 690.94]